MTPDSTAKLQEHPISPEAQAAFQSHPSPHFVGGSPALLPIPHIYWTSLTNTLSSVLAEFRVQESSSGDTGLEPVRSSDFLQGHTV